MTHQAPGRESGRLPDSARVLLIAGTCNLLAAFHGCLYGVLTSLGEAAPLPGNWVYGFAVGALVFSFVVATPVLSVHLRPLDRAMRALRAGAQPDPATLERARRIALNLPVTSSRMSTFLWMLCAASLPVAAAWLSPDVEPLALLHAVLVAMVMASVSSVFIYYLVELYARRYLIEVLVPHDRLFDLGAQPVTIAFKLLVLLTLSVILPALLLSVASALGALTPVVALFLGASFFALGVYQALFIVGSVTRPVAQLVEQVRRVGTGDLNAHASAVSLDDIGRLAAGFNDMVAGLRRAEFVKETFGRYVTRQVLDEILKGKIELGGELRPATVLFSDIRGFTALSERLPATDVVRFLNEYLDMMVDVVVEHGGTVDKFIGDAIMASFGVPLQGEDDALRATKAGLGMVARLDRWNTQRVGRGEPPIEIGIGIHTGDVVAGNIGSTKKMEYTVIGDTVNTASRIEQLNKQLGTRLLVSEATYHAVARHVVGRALPPVEVKGKAQAITVYEVTALRPA